MVDVVFFAIIVFAACWFFYALIREHYKVKNRKPVETNVGKVAITVTDNTGNSFDIELFGSAWYYRSCNEILVSGVNMTVATWREQAGKTGMVRVSNVANVSHYIPLCNVADIKMVFDNHTEMV